MATSINKAKINRGTLVEIPEICIDQFGTISSHVNWKTSQAFFLTHYDDEITQDVLSMKFLDKISDPTANCRLYLHELTFQYLIYWTTTIYVENGQFISSYLDKLLSAGRIVFLKTNRPIKLRFQNSEQIDTHVEVTALSSGSNLGSIMLLIESLGEAGMCILYTGDCRLTLKDLRTNHCLHQTDGTVKKISKLYLDTTFCLEDTRELPLRNQVTDLLLTAVVIDSKMNGKKHYEISTPSKLEHLAFLQKLNERFQRGIHVPHNLMKFLQKLPEFKGLVHSKIQVADRFHFDCGESCDNETCGNGLEWGIEFEVSSVNLSSNFLYHYENLGNAVCRDDENNWCKYGLKYYISKTHDYYGIYSCHLSRYEMGRLINFFGVKPKDVVPLHKSPMMGPDEILLEIGCANGKVEPECFLEELPSYCYDFTSSQILCQPKFEIGPLEKVLPHIQVSSASQGVDIQVMTTFSL